MGTSHNCEKEAIVLLVAVLKAELENFWASPSLHMKDPEERLNKFEPGVFGADNDEIDLSV